MNSPELFLISLARALVEVALFALLAQAVLAVLAGKTRDRNAVYRLMQTITSPAVKCMRMLMPRFILDRHLPFIAFFILFWLWIGLAIAKRYVCVSSGLSC
jgi:uncharacterized protein YggT (Ycf19 family)